MIIGWLVSLSRRRLVATLVAVLLGCAFPVLSTLALNLPDSTWVALSPLPEPLRAPLFALAVDPANNQTVVAGTSQGTIFRTVDGGATWTSVLSGRSAVLTIGFSPFDSGLALAGTRGAGAMVSVDRGATWTPVTGLGGRAVRVFGFARAVIAAGTDKGVFVSPDGRSWTQSGLADVSIDAIAVAAQFSPAHFIVGGDTASLGAALPLFDSTDAGKTWTPIRAALGSSVIVSRLVSGGLPVSGVRPLLIGTNSGIYASADNGATFTPLTGGSLLPATDYTQAVFVTDHSDRYYVASDGGGSQAGGIWTTGDAGQHFSSLFPPAPSVTALAVSNDEAPILYLATFRPAGHSGTLWAYHDTGGSPQQPIGASPTPASGARIQSSSGQGALGFLHFLTASQAPYIGLGALAFAVILFAVIANLRSARR